MIIFVFIVLGLCLGSFINALVWRLHQKEQRVESGEQSKAKGKKLTTHHSTLTTKDLSIWKGRSMCPNCKHELKAADLVPVLSWLWLKGKCRYCHKPIAWQYPAVELITAFLFVFSYLLWPTQLSALSSQLSLAFWLVILVGLVALAVYDIKWMLLPDKLVFFLMGLAVIQVLIVFLAFDSTFQYIGQVCLSFLIGGGLFYAIFQLSDGKWIGGGDVKLGALLGLILADPALTFMMILSASVLGTIFSLPLMATNKINRNTHIPFGPFLIAGAIFAQLFGAAIISWYRGLLL